MKMEVQNKVRKIVMTGVFAAMLAVLSQISFPLPSGIPVTLQTFAVALCGFVLGPRLGLLPSRKPLPGRQCRMNNHRETIRGTTGR